MRKTFHFFKQNNKWYADLPNNNLEENEMIEGGDTLLQYLSEGPDRVSLIVSTSKESKKTLHLKLIQHNECGATYMMGSDPKDTV